MRLRETYIFGRGECVPPIRYMIFPPREPSLSLVQEAGCLMVSRIWKSIHAGLQGAMMVRHDWSDDDLALRLHKRDPEALETLISRYSREIFYFIRLVLDGIGVAQDAEECVNDLFVAVWQEIDTFDANRGTLHTWLTMRAKYIALDRRRQLCRRQAHSMQPADETRQWGSADGSGNRRSSGHGYEYDHRVILPPHPEA